MLPNQNTNLPIPIPSPSAKPVAQPKTLPHALSRAAKSGATELGGSDRLGIALGVYGAAMEKVHVPLSSDGLMKADRWIRSATRASPRMLLFPTGSSLRGPPLCPPPLVWR